MTLALFEDPLPPRAARSLAPGAVLLQGFCRDLGAALLQAVADVAAQAPWRHLITPGGYRMSVAMTNCGPLGWTSDRTGYRYAPNDPASALPWPAMPAAFAALAASAAQAAGFGHFAPDACLINRYLPGTKLSLHQDRDEQELAHPIVSVSLGIPAMFLFGGLARADRCERIPVAHGDVLVWGGPARLRYHGVLPLKEAAHPLSGRCRINLTFRKAGASHGAQVTGRAPPHP
ncbi:MAG: DNA oxidative demethylase AlkB [Ramlibacter sp.]